MRRIAIPVIVLMATLATMTSAWAEAPADDTAPSRRRAVEQLKLACRGVVHDGRPVVGCRWSQSHHPRFAAYRLWRSDGSQRAVVFRTRDRDHTFYLDRAVRVGQDYSYLVQAVNQRGRTVGRSNVAQVSCCPSPSEPKREPSRKPTRPEAAPTSAVVPLPAIP